MARNRWHHAYRQPTHVEQAPLCLASCAGLELHLAFVGQRRRHDGTTFLNHLGKTANEPSSYGRPQLIASRRHLLLQ